MPRDRRRWQGFPLLFGVLDEGHAEEIGDFPGTRKTVFFVEAHGALERLGSIERDARAPFGEQMFFHGFQQALGDAASVALRRYGHSAEVAFRGGDHRAANRSNDTA